MDEYKRVEIGKANLLGMQLFTRTADPEAEYLWRGSEGQEPYVLQAMVGGAYAHVTVWLDKPPCYESEVIFAFKVVIATANAPVRDACALGIEVYKASCIKFLSDVGIVPNMYETINDLARIVSQNVAW